MMITTSSYQSIMNDETLCDDLTTLNQNSSSSMLYRTLNIHYISQEYIFRKETSKIKLINQDNTKTEQPDKSELCKKLTPRNIAVMELITSEQRFVHDMKNILKTYITPMLESNILSSSHIDALFLNWPSLTRTHEKLANSLINDKEQISIGKILCEFLPELITEYEVYFRFHPTAMKCFRQQLHISSKFRAFMQKTKEQTYGIGTMGDANILTLPLQRIAKYPFMIYQIIKNTSNNCDDLIQLNNSLEKANELRETINNAIDEEINRVKFEWLQNHVDCRKLNEIIIFNSLTHFGEQRKLIHYNHIKMNNHNLYAILFNDFLLLTRIKRRLITKFIQIIHQRDISNIDWFDSSYGKYIHLIIYKKPIMLHEIRNIRINKNDLRSFQFDYYGNEMIFITNSTNERILWMKYLNDNIQISRQKCLITSMFRIPIDFDFNSIGNIFIRAINAINLPLISIKKNGNNPYCIIEMNNSQRQTTPVICDRSNLQWIVSFRFFIWDIKYDFIKCSIYNRSKYTTDRLLGSIEIPLKLLIEQEDISLLNCQKRTFYLKHSSNNSQISIKYHVYFK